MEIKKWAVEYSHKDGRKGKVHLTTEVSKSNAFEYGNGKHGTLAIDDDQVQSYDLRYCNEEDLHMAMIKDFFGDGLVSAIAV